MNAPNYYGVFLNASYDSTNKTTTLILYSNSTNYWLGGNSIYYISISAAFSGYLNPALPNPLFSYISIANYTQNICPYSYFLDTPTLLPMNTTVLLGFAVDQSFNNLRDFVSRHYGSRDGLSKCDKRTYKIVDPTDFISVDNDKFMILINSKTANNIGSYNITILASLEKYPAVKTSFLVSVTIYPCVITDIFLLSARTVISY